MKRGLIILASLLLSACATQVVSSDPRSVIVESQSLNAAEAQKQANAECQKHGKYAMMTAKAGYWDRNYVFACIN